MDRPLVEVLVIMALLLVNGVFAMAEIAVVSARRARLQGMANAGNEGARAALLLATNPSQFLSTVQVGITLVGILAGAFGGATVAETVAGLLNRVPLLAQYSEPLSLALVVLLITYGSLILGELVPKRIALGNPERVASLVAPPMRALSAWASPAVRFLGGSTEVVLRVLRVREVVEAPVTAEEINILIDMGADHGVFVEVEQEMVENVLRLGRRKVSALMTPRHRIVWLRTDDSVEEIARKVESSHHSYFPVADETLDDVLGTVRVSDLLTRALAGTSIDLDELVRAPVFVHETSSALRVLDVLKERGTHIALVMDEHGSLQGLVTHNDILEDVAGEPGTTAVEGEPAATRRDDGSWLLDGLMDVETVKDVLGISRWPAEDRVGFDTLGGFVITRLGAIPRAAQNFEWAGYRFEVVDMDGLRVDKVLVSRLEQGSP